VITPRAVVLGSALPALVLVTLVAVPGAWPVAGPGERGRPANIAPTALPSSVPTTVATGDAKERRALTLLRRSVRVGASLGFTGTQTVTTWHDQGATSEVLDVVQRAGGGRTVTARGVAGSADGARSIVRTPVADGSVGPASRALDALAAAWELRPATRTTVAGRDATEVVAARGAHVGARMWVDDDTGLLLRQDVLDDAGRLHRMSTYLDLRIGGPAPASPQAGSPATAGWSHVVGPVELQRWRTAGHPCPETLPGGYRLLDVRSDQAADGPVLQLVYGDGLSAISVFLQSGTLDDDRLTGLTEVDRDAGVFWERHGWPELVVWQSGRTVITAVADAEPTDLRIALSAFPGQRSGFQERGTLGSLQDAMGSALAWFRG
jgi:MucB/RseB family protein